MPITSSGQISLVGDIAGEFTDLGSSSVSMAAARDAAGLSSGEVAMTDFYGLSDAVASTVSSDSTANVSTSQIRVYGTVSSDGGGTITDRGFYFGTSSNYASNTKYSQSGTTGGFNRLFTGLSSNTTYYYTAYAVNSVGESRGTTKSQATSFAYTFKSPIYSTNFGSVNSGGMYYYLVSGSWALRSSYNFNAGSTCISVCTNRQSRSYCSTNGSGNYITVQKNGCCCSGAPTLSIGGVSKVAGDYFQNGSSYLKCNGRGDGHDFRFTAT